jgi:O-antigen/teichoic acid export membrane protein
MAVAAGLLITGMACVGPAFIRVLYNNQYNEAAGFIRLLAVSAWFTALIVPGEFALLALGRTRPVAFAQAVRLACLPILLFTGYEIGGIPGLILGVAVGEMIRYVVVAMFLRRDGLQVFAEDAALTLFAASILGLYLLSESVAGVSGKVAVPIVGGLIESIIWAGVYAAWARPGNLSGWLHQLWL